MKTGPAHAEVIFRTNIKMKVLFSKKVMFTDAAMPLHPKEVQKKKQSEPRDFQMTAKPPEKEEMKYYAT